MTNLKLFKSTLSKMGVHFLEEVHDEYTYIVVASPKDDCRKINLVRDKFWEFDKDERIASY